MKRYIKKILVIVCVAFILFGSIFAFIKPKRAYADYLEPLPYGYNLMFVVTVQESQVDFVVNVIYDSMQGAVNHTAEIDLTQSSWSGFDGYFYVNGIYFGAGSYTINGDLVLTAPYWSLSFAEYTSTSSYDSGAEDTRNYFLNSYIPENYYSKEYVNDYYTANVDLVAPNWYSGYEYTTYGNMQYTNGWDARAELGTGELDTDFKHFLSDLFKFPGRFFKEAFDVDIMGINVGGLISGVFFFAVAFGIIGVIRRVV